MHTHTHPHTHTHNHTHATSRCMHQAMNPYEPSACPLCRTRFAHFPRVCPRLHALLEAAFPEAYARRAAETAGEALRCCAPATLAAASSGFSSHDRSV